MTINLLIHGRELTVRYLDVAPEQIRRGSCYYCKQTTKLNPERSFFQDSQIIEFLSADGVELPLEGELFQKTLTALKKVLLQDRIHCDQCVDRHEQETTESFRNAC